MRPQGSVERHFGMLRAWQLALLRFAVTLDNVDRMNVMAIANEIDRGGHTPEEPATFRFFRKTSADLCMAISRQHESADAILRQFLTQIEDDRLSRAFIGAMEIDHQAPTVRKPKNDNGLWRGLSPRGDIPSSAR